jgi:hypothetical protein
MSERGEERRYAEYSGPIPPPPPPDGIASIHIRVLVDLEGWARDHGVSVEEAAQVLHERSHAADMTVTATYLRALGDFQPIQSVVST